MGSASLPTWEVRGVPPSLRTLWSQPSRANANYFDFVEVSAAVTIFHFEHQRVVVTAGRLWITLTSPRPLILRTSTSELRSGSDAPTVARSSRSGPPPTSCDQTRLPRTLTRMVPSTRPDQRIPEPLSAGEPPSGDRMPEAPLSAGPPPSQVKVKAYGAAPDCSSRIRTFAAKPFCALGCSISSTRPRPLMPVTYLFHPSRHRC